MWKITFSSCSSHCGSVKAELHGQTDGGGDDATNLSDQKRFDIVHGYTLPQRIQSLLGVSVKRWPIGSL